MFKKVQSPPEGRSIKRKDRLEEDVTLENKKPMVVNLEEFEQVFEDDDDALFNDALKT